MKIGEKTNKGTVRYIRYEGNQVEVVIEPYKGGNWIQVIEKKDKIDKQLKLIL